MYSRPGNRQPFQAPRKPVGQRITRYDAKIPSREEWKTMTSIGQEELRRELGLTIISSA